MNEALCLMLLSIIITLVKFIYGFFKIESCPLFTVFTAI
jgi:hypothetical protein